MTELMKSKKWGDFTGWLEPDLQSFFPRFTIGDMALGKSKEAYLCELGRVVAIVEKSTGKDVYGLHDQYTPLVPSMGWQRFSINSHRADESIPIG